ncbi:MAG: putative lipoprotein [Labilithrix sp.]|nr:putative lipoprotein [Labilithrix sp.]
MARPVRSLIGRTMKTTARALPLLTFLALLSLVTGCHQAAPESQSSAPAAAIAAGGGDVGASQLAAAADRSLIVTMDVSLTVENVERATVSLRSSVEHAGGFVSDSRSSGTDGQQTAHLELRVPADKARNIRTSLGDLGEVTSSSEKVEDVTEQRADIEARLRSARTQEKRLLDIMGAKASSIHELVETEKELARIRENIERLEAQEHVMKSRIQLATVHVTLVTRSIPAWQTPGPSILRAGKGGVQAAGAISVCAGMALAAVGPTLLPIFCVILGIVVAVRRRRAKTLATLVG